MQTRILSSFAVVLLGLAPTLVGGPVFALCLLMLAIAGFREFVDLAARLGPDDVAGLAGVGAFTITVFGVAALAGDAALLLYAAVAIAFVLPLIIVLATHRGSFLASSLIGTGSLYLGLPIFAAILLRATPGDVAPWLTEVAGRLSLGWSSYPRGLAWAIIVIVATWIGDTTAFLAGRAIGGRKLAPRISPNKTIAGAITGMTGSAAVGALAFSVFAMGTPWIGLAAGAVIGIAGQFGDLAESYLKRQAGLKDSGNLIPGHGGLLDRIDALLFAFPAGLFLAAAYEWWGLR